MKPYISIIGCGRVGTCLAVFLARAGYELSGLAGIPHNTAHDASKLAGKGLVYENPVDAARVCDVLFLTTPDGTIEKVCAQLAGQMDDMSGKTVYHCSGALPSSILAAAAAKGASTCSIHPLQSFAPFRDDQTSPFRGINFCLEGDKTAVERGGKIIEALGGSFFSIPTNAKVLYHAAAVVASNYLVTLQHAAMELLVPAGLSEKEAFKILEPLIQGTLGNIKSRGAAAALTGPVVRGDAPTVAGHMKDIKNFKPEFSEFYKVMGAYTLKLARRQGTLSQSEEYALDALFR